MADVLQHAARRRILRHLLEGDGRADVSALGGAQVSVTEDSFVDAVTALHDLHLPKLESAGLIEKIGEAVVTLAVPLGRARELLAKVGSA